MAPLVARHESCWSTPVGVGSVWKEPTDIVISLSWLVAGIAEEPWRNKLIAFSQRVQVDEASSLDHLEDRYNATAYGTRNGTITQTSSCFRSNSVRGEGVRSFYARYASHGVLLF